MRVGKPQRDGAPADVGEADHALLHLEALDGGERLVGRLPLLDAPLQVAVPALFVAQHPRRDQQFLCGRMLARGAGGFGEHVGAGGEGGQVGLEVAPDDAGPDDRVAVGDLRAPRLGLGRVPLHEFSAERGQRLGAVLLWVADETLEAVPAREEVRRDDAAVVARAAGEEDGERGGGGGGGGGAAVFLFAGDSGHG